MICIDEKAEFTLLIKDLIETLSHTSKFTFNVWINNIELPYEFKDTDSFYFSQEGFRVDNGSMIVYVFYDNIASMKIDYK